MAGVIKLRRNTVEQQCFFSRSKEVKLERNFFPNCVRGTLKQSLRNTKQISSMCHFG